MRDVKGYTEVSTNNYYYLFLCLNLSQTSSSTVLSEKSLFKAALKYLVITATMSAILNWVRNMWLKLGIKNLNVTFQILIWMLHCWTISFQNAQGELKSITRLHLVLFLHYLIFPTSLHRNLFALYHLNAFTKLMVEVVQLVAVVVVDNVAHGIDRLLLEIQVMV